MQNSIYLILILAKYNILNMIKIVFLSHEYKSVDLMLLKKIDRWMDA